MKKFSPSNKNTVIIFYGLFFEQLSYDWIPYGPLFVSAWLKEAGFNPIVIHEFKDRDYEHILRAHAADTLFFGVSAMTGYQIQSGLRAVNIFRKYCDYNTPIVWGGAHATAVPLNTLSSKDADFVQVGDVKNSFIDFARRLKSGGVEDVNFPDILRLDTFPDPAKRYEMVDYKNDFTGFPSLHYEDYDFDYLLTENRVLNYVASVGCPGQCTFCSFGGRHPWVPLPVERVLDDVEYLVDRYKLKSLWFADSDFTLDRNFPLQIARGLMDRKIDIYWRFNSRVPEFTKYTLEDYKLLNKAGLDRVFVGIENINVEIQKLYRKRFSQEMVFKILKDMKNLDTQVMMSFIFGNPRSKNDLEENRAFLDKCRSINRNVKFQVCMYTPYPGTPVTDLAEIDGYVPPATLEAFGTCDDFLDTSRSVLETKLAWFPPDLSEKYIKRYVELFPETDASPDWNWRSGTGSFKRNELLPMILRTALAQRAI